MKIENPPLANQIAQLEQILRESPVINRVLRQAPELRAPNWYLAAGSVQQTVWNHLHGFPTANHINDCDLIYFDQDQSSDAQNRYIERGKRIFHNAPIPVEIVNEARVHLWYPHVFGRSIPPYTSVEQAISSWSVTSSCIGVRSSPRQKTLAVFAPYGLDDLFNLIIRPNQHTIFNKDEYYIKVNRWSTVWPKLTVIPWPE